MKKILIAIPARLESKRLPRKLLAIINKKTLLQRAYESCKNASLDSKIFICTDSKEIASSAKKWGATIIMTSKECKTGTDRISSVLDELLMNAWEVDKNELRKNKSYLLNNTGIINVQGDQPFLDPLILRSMYKELNKIEKNFSLITPIYKLNRKDIHNPSVVKTLVSKNNEALYFSRSAIPFMRDIDKSEWHKYYTYWGHVGIYGFKAEVLETWANLCSSDLEKAEKLEQLRAIDSGLRIGTYQVKSFTFSVDTEEQLNYARDLAEQFEE